MIKDTSIPEGRILIFATAGNFQKLGNAAYWVTDGTFKAVLTIVYLLYTILAPIDWEKQRTFPFVYVVMTEKRESLYKRLYEDLVVCRTIKTRVRGRFITE